MSLQQFNNNVKIKINNVNVKTRTVYTLFPQARVEWHLQLHLTFALKHLHRFDEHLLLPLQLHLTKPCPPHFDSTWTAFLRPISHSTFTSPSLNSFCAHKSNRFREYFPFKIPPWTAILYILSSRSCITPIIFLGSPRLRSTYGIGIVTLSPGFPGTCSTRLRLGNVEGTQKN